MKFNIPVEIEVIDHHDSFTYNIVSWLREAGLIIQVFSYDEDNLLDKIESFDAILYSPGPGHPQSYSQSHQLLNYYFHKKPQIGICLGMQMMLLLKGNTIESTGPIHGKVALIRHNRQGLFDRLTSPIAVARYHSLGCTSCVGFARTAEVNGITMAIQNDEEKILGVQFHPESFLTHHADKMAQNLKQWILKMGEKA